MLGDRAHRVDTAAVLLREGTGLLRDQSVRLARRIFSRFAFLEFLAAQNLAKNQNGRARDSAKTLPVIPVWCVARRAETVPVRVQNF